MHCASCVRSVEVSLRAVPGVDEATVNLHTGQALVTHVADRGVSDLVEAVRRAGYSANEASSEFVGIEDKQARDRQWRWWYVAAAAAALIMLLSGWSRPTVAWLQLVIAAPVQVILGAPFYRGALSALKRLRADMDSLVAMGTTVAFVYSVVATTQSIQPVYFETAVMILVLIRLGRLLEHRARATAYSALSGLIRLQPSEATVVRQGKLKTVEIADVVPGDVVLVRPGQRVPVDGTLTEGESSVDQSLVTGESMPVEIRPGAEVIAGTVNQSGAFRMRAARTGRDTTLAQIVRLVSQAQMSKARVQRVVDSVASVFVPVVLILAGQTFGLWMWGGQDWAKAVNATVAVLIVACPCALGLATPTAIMVGTALGARSGVLIKDAAAIERARRLTHIVLDKTGTLTHGRFAVQEIVCLDRSLDERRLLQLAASVETLSEHPIGRAIVDEAEQKGLAVIPVTGFERMTVGGVSGVVDRMQIVVGRLPIIRDRGTKAVDELVVLSQALREKYRTVVAVAIDGWAVGIIGLTDAIKPEAASVVARLRDMGLEVVMMTGDHEVAAREVASQLGIKVTLADVSPREKHDHVLELKRQGGVVAMVGDGINDAPALAAADIGIAMGQAGQTTKRRGKSRSAPTDIAAQAGHVVLMGGDLNGLVQAIKLSRATMRRIWLGLFWASIYNLVLIPVAALGWLNPMLAAAAMSASSICVVLNALWLRRSAEY